MRKIYSGVIILVLIPAIIFVLRNTGSPGLMSTDVYLVETDITYMTAGSGLDGFSFLSTPVYNSYSDDGNNFVIKSNDTNNDNLVFIYFEANMQINTTGLLYYEAYVTTDNGSSQTMNGIFNITNSIISEIDLGGYVTFFFQGRASDWGGSTTNNIWVYTNTNSMINIVEFSSDMNTGTISYGEWQIDEFRFVPVT